MILLSMPIGNKHGWGICGKYLFLEMSKKCATNILPTDIRNEDFDDELESSFFRDTLQSNKIPNTVQAILHGLGGDFSVYNGSLSTTSKNHFGYTFFENTNINFQNLQATANFLHTVICGSKWNEELINNFKVKNTKTIIQGIDPILFNQYSNEKNYYRDRFVIFSGGKFEYRKGQDLVIKAFKYLQDKYKDVLLVTSWYNGWSESFNTMDMSNMNFSPLLSNVDFYTNLNYILVSNGIDLKNVISLPPMSNKMMGYIYKNTDIGLFPNRAEGGTNLVLMEYMACAKPTIASYNTGHKDILTKQNSILLNKMKKIDVKNKEQSFGQWYEADIDEIIYKLEKAYLNYSKTKKIATQAGNDLSKLTWKYSAKQFLNLMHKESI